MTDAELQLLPRSYQIVGKILLLKLKPGLLKHKKQIGSAVLELLPYLKTVCLLSAIFDIKRKPYIEIVAGENSFKTLHKENGCLFEIDVSKSMFSKGNKAEKMRLVNSAKPNETVIDMFAGIGYWTIPVAKLTKAKKIFAIDINPEAVKYLEKNVFLNNISGTHEKRSFSAEPESEIPCQVEILKGDCRGFANIFENTADRIIMGYIFETEKFLPAALKMAKDNCIIHFHRNANMEEIEQMKNNIIEAAGKSGYEIQVLSVRKVKSYAPRVWHLVTDLKVHKKIIKP